MNQFGDNLKRLRQAYGISQADLAQRLNTTQQRVSEWERNKIEPSLFNIIKILSVLEISFEELTEGLYLE